MRLCVCASYNYKRTQEQLVDLCLHLKASKRKKAVLERSPDVKAGMNIDAAKQQAAERPGDG